jgi:hypothetical protein
MIIGKKRKGILQLMRIGLICLQASVYAQDRLSINEDLMIDTPHKLMSQRQSV